jgi:hypothetical protein
MSISPISSSLTPSVYTSQTSPGQTKETDAQPPAPPPGPPPPPPSDSGGDHDGDDGTYTPSSVQNK